MSSEPLCVQQGTKKGRNRVKASDRPGVKEFAYQEYIVNNKSAKEIAQRIQNELNIPITERQVKLMMAEEKDATKNIDYDTYFAMDMVSKFAPPLEFHIKLVQLKKISPRQLKKEIDRKLKAKERKSGAPDTLSKALEVLASKNVTARLFQSKDDPRPVSEFINANGYMVSMQTMEQDNADEDKNIPESEYQSDATDTSMEDVDSCPTTLDDADLVSQNFAIELPRYRDGLLPQSSGVSRRQYDLVPAPAALTIDLATAVLPESIGHRITGAGYEEPVSIMPSSPNNDITWQESLDSSEPLAQLFGTLTLSMDDGRSPIQRDKQREKRTYQVLWRNWHSFDEDGSWSLIVQFASYYLMQCWARYNDLDPFYDPDRVEARRQLTDLIARNHGDVLTIVYWIGTVLAAHGQDRQMVSFYLDCWHCCERSSSYVNRIVVPVLRFIMLRLCTSKEQHIRDLLDESQIQEFNQLRETFNAKEQLDSASRLAEQRGQQPSRTALILALYQAWHLMDVGRHYESIDLMLTNLRRKAQSVMGERHIVTIGYYSMMAENYKRMDPPDLQLSQRYQEHIVFYLCHCARAMEPIRYMAMEQLASIADAVKDVSKATSLLEEVYQYRLRTFGALSPDTWHPANRLWDLLRRQGRGREADEGNAELTRRFEEVSTQLRGMRR